MKEIIEVIGVPVLALIGGFIIPVSVEVGLVILVTMIIVYLWQLDEEVEA